jgi:hypothetical protein
VPILWRLHPPRIDHAEVPPPEALAPMAQLPELGVRAYLNLEREGLIGD